MQILDKNISTYIEKHSLKNIPDELLDIKNMANINNIPIILNETLSLLKLLIKIKKPKKILEIGTAIGYSGSLMLLNSENSFLHTIEVNENNFKEACKNFNSIGLTNRVCQYLGDAKEILKDKIVLKDEIDFLFIDAAKSQYLDYFKLSEKFLSNNAFIFCDNILYKGIVAGIPHIRRNNTIENRMNEFVEFCINNKKYNFTLLNVGDGILIGEKNE